MDISVVVPLLNESESLPELCSRIAAVMHEEGLSYEILLIDDGSTDAAQYDSSTPYCTTPPPTAAPPTSRAWSWR